MNTCGGSTAITVVFPHLRCSARRPCLRQRSFPRGEDGAVRASSIFVGGVVRAVAVKDTAKHGFV